MPVTVIAPLPVASNWTPGSRATPILSTPVTVPMLSPVIVSAPLPVERTIVPPCSHTPMFRSVPELPWPAIEMFAVPVDSIKTGPLVATPELP